MVSLHISAYSGTEIAEDSAAESFGQFEPSGSIDGCIVDKFPQRGVHHFSLSKAFEDGFVFYFLEDIVAFDIYQ